MKNNSFLLAIPVLLILWLFFKKKSPSTEDFEDNHFTYNGQKATISSGKANSLAIQLKAEFSKFNSSESLIVSLFLGLNEADYILIYEAFGLMRKDPIFGNGSLIIGQQYNLTEWLADVLDDEINDMKEMFPSIF
jgi:hypothetical protein